MATGDGKDTGETVYNSTDGPLTIDDEGRVLGARSRLEDVDTKAEPVKGHIDAGRMIIVGGPTKRTVRNQQEG